MFLLNIQRQQAKAVLKGPLQNLAGSKDSGGEECFYTNGYTLWNAMRLQAEYLGFRVAMPSPCCFHTMDRLSRVKP